MKVLIASDHAGFPLKQNLQRDLNEIEWIDLGPDTDERVDYPDYAKKLCKEFLKGGYDFAVLTCGSGQGVAITANRFRGIRAALCWKPEVAAITRQHNDANVLCLPGRLLESNGATEICKTFFATEFEGGRHLQRITKIDAD